MEKRIEQCSSLEQIPVRYRLLSPRPGFNWRLIFALLSFLIVAPFTGCRRNGPPRIQGYVEGEYVYVASSAPGILKKLHISRGSQVKAGDLLFELESEPEFSARGEAEQRLRQAQAELSDVEKGLRPSELKSIDAQLAQARAALVYSEKEFNRQQTLAQQGAAPKQELDRARSTYTQDQQRVTQLESEAATGRLGAREDRVTAAKGNVSALESSLRRAEWNLAEKSRAAPEAAFVFDTIYNEGEWVPAGRPVVSLLPPGNIKIRAFVPERSIGAVSVGQSVRVSVDGSAPVTGKVNYISPQSEFTPPVIYSEESREKLVFMIEASLPPDDAAKMHPGQPVDLDFD